MANNKNNEIDVDTILKQIINQFDNVSKFNDGQLEINKLLMEMVNTLEKRIEQLEERNAKLEEEIKDVRKLAMI